MKKLLLVTIVWMSLSPAHAASLEIECGTRKVLRYIPAYLSVTVDLLKQDIAYTYRPEGGGSEQTGKLKADFGAYADTDLHFGAREEFLDKNLIFQAHHESWTRVHYVNDIALELSEKDGVHHLQKFEVKGSGTFPSELSVPAGLPCTLK